MLVVVNERHIAAGVAFDPCMCPVALAIKEALGIDADSTGRVHADLHAIRVNDLYIATPDDVGSFMLSFDHGKHPGGITFELVLPDRHGMIHETGQLTREQGCRGDDGTPTGEVS